MNQGSSHTEALEIWKCLNINGLERKRLTKSELAFELLYLQ